MDERGIRRAVIASIVAVTLVVVTGIGTTAFFVIRKQHRADDVAAAARVAAAYNKKVSAYRSSVQSALTSTDPEDAKKLWRAFEAAVGRTPKLGDAPNWGKTHSESYSKARKTAKTLTDAYDEVSSVLEEAQLGQPMIKAAKIALRVQIEDFLPNGALSNATSIRSKLIPGFTKALTAFNDDTENVPGAVTVANNVRAVLRGVLIQAERAADDLDAGRSASIDVRREYIVAASGVIDYEESLRSRLETAIRKSAEVVSGQSSTESVT